MTEAAAVKPTDQTEQPIDAQPKKLTKKELRILERQKAAVSAHFPCTEHQT